MKPAEQPPIRLSADRFPQRPADWTRRERDFADAYERKVEDFARETRRADRLEMENQRLRRELAETRRSTQPEAITQAARDADDES